MAYLAFYRTFRPTTFESVVRQEHIVKILKNQITSGKVGHAYLFCGPRGTGKTTLAKIFARAINCQSPVDGSPCGKCPTCLALASGSNLDISEIDAASNNGVDEMRDLREKVQYPPVSGKYKVYIIDEVHMLTASAFNAVLKTLEEPPRHAVFILATTEPQKIPATILSRCMRFDFKLIPQSDLEGLIKSVYDKTGKQYEDEAISLIARAGAGSARDSLSIADMCASYSQGKLTYEDVNAVLGSADFFDVGKIVSAVVDEDVSSALSHVVATLSTGKGVGVLTKDLLDFVNNLSIVKMCKEGKSILHLPDDRYKVYFDIAAKADGHKLLRITEIFAKVESDMRYTLNARITLETAIIKASMPQADYNIDALMGKIAHLENQLKDGIKVSVQAQPSPQAIPQPKPEEQPKKVAEKKATPQMEETSSFGEDPFATNSGSFNKAPEAEHTQPTIWEQPQVNSQAPANTSTLSEADKKAVFGKFLRLFRTTKKNAVLFTLCMDLDSRFEGDKFVMYTQTEAVYKALTREENSRFIAETLALLGVYSHEVRLTPKGEDKYESAVNQLKENFKGTNINIK
jgi:DNA polymerase-3 subunit gamma/tau